MKLVYLTIFGGFLLCLMVAGTTSAAPSTGNITIAFIMVEFEDKEFQEEHDQDYFEDLAFESTNSMWHYYDEVSKSKLDIGGDVYGPYTLDGNAADYSSGTAFVAESVSCRFRLKMQNNSSTASGYLLTLVCFAWINFSVTADE